MWPYDDEDGEYDKDDHDLSIGNSDEDGEVTHLLVPLGALPTYTPGTPPPIGVRLTSYYLLDLRSPALLQ